MTAGFECCLHFLMNVYFSTEGSERLHKEEASDEDEDTEYFDAMEDSPAFITVTATENTQHRSVTSRDSETFEIFLIWQNSRTGHRQTHTEIKVLLGFSI